MSGQHITYKQLHQKFSISICSNVNQQGVTILFTNSNHLFSKVLAHKSMVCERLIFVKVGTHLPKLVKRSRRNLIALTCVFSALIQHSALSLSHVFCYCQVLINGLEGTANVWASTNKTNLNLTPNHKHQKHTHTHTTHRQNTQTTTVTTTTPKWMSVVPAVWRVSGGVTEAMVVTVRVTGTVRHLTPQPRPPCSARTDVLTAVTPTWSTPWHTLLMAHLTYNMTHIILLTAHLKYNISPITLLTTDPCWSR
jgi:hypothetical protein